MLKPRSMIRLKKKQDLASFIISKSGLNTEYIMPVSGKRAPRAHYTPSEHISRNEMLLGIHDRDLDDNMNACRELLNTKELYIIDFVNIIDFSKP